MLSELDGSRKRNLVILSAMDDYSGFSHASINTLKGFGIYSPGKFYRYVRQTSAIEENGPATLGDIEYALNSFDPPLHPLVRDELTQILKKEFRIRN